MPKYVNLWEMDMSRIPADPNECMMLLQKMTEMTKQVLKEHPGAQWGSFIGENKGFAVGEMSWQDIVKINQMFAPYVINKTYQAASIEELEGVLKSMMPPK